jgi:hypothetical protein
MDNMLPGPLHAGVAASDKSRSIHPESETGVRATEIELIRVFVAKIVTRENSLNSQSWRRSLVLFLLISLFLFSKFGTEPVADTQHIYSI